MNAVATGRPGISCDAASVASGVLAPWRFTDYQATRFHLMIFYQRVALLFTTDILMACFQCEISAAIISTGLAIMLLHAITADWRQGTGREYATGTATEVPASIAYNQCVEYKPSLQPTSRVDDETYASMTKKYCADLHTTSQYVGTMRWREAALFMHWPQRFAAGRGGRINGHVATFENNFTKASMP